MLLGKFHVGFVGFRASEAANGVHDERAEGRVGVCAGVDEVDVLEQDVATEVQLA